MELSSSVSTNAPVVVMLSSNAKATAHPGDRWKAGYIFGSTAQNKSGWRNVHISKRSFEKFIEHLADLQEAVKNETTHQLMLTRKQYIVTTQLVREGKGTQQFV